MSVDSQDLPRPFGPFTLLRLIAQGGMGAVFLALRPLPTEETSKRQSPAGRTAHEEVLISSGAGAPEVCVVKTVRSDLKADREAVGRFLDEARVVQKLHHPRIARTIDAGIIDKTYFLSLEFISGRNLRDVQTRAQKLGRALPEALMVHVVADMLEALAHAHGLDDADTNQPLNIVHRDVSPHNVMLGFDGNTKLIDFGLAAHELKRELTRPGVMVGKLRYNAPEQVRDKALDGRSDVYSAAVVLYEFIANERFYEGLPEEQVWRVAMKGDHRPNSWRDIDQDWRHLLDVALQNDPQKRYRGAGEFRDALLDVAEARGVDLKNMRRDASKFMRDAFGSEQAHEREMILQATGIAEARTRLFRSPSEMQSALSDLGASRSAEVKTQIFDPAQLGGRGADHLRELQNMMSRFADPNAETQLPRDPISEDDVPDSFHVDTADSLSSASERAVVAPLGQQGGNRIEATVAGRLGPRANDTEAELEPKTADPPKRAAARSRPEPLPPLAPKKKAASPVLALLLGLVVVALIGGLAIVAVPRLLKPKTTPLQPESDAGVVVIAEPPPPLVDAGVVLVPPPPPLVIDAGTALMEVVDAGRAVHDSVDAGASALAAAADAGTTDATDAGAARVEEPPAKKKAPKPKTPPPRTPKSFKDQVEYLRQFCLTRVACAPSVVTSAGSVMSLSTDELRSLKEAAPRCVERCQR